jgi:hypothetical protein
MRENGGNYDILDDTYHDAWSADSSSEYCSWSTENTKKKETQNNQAKTTKKNGKKVL